MAVNELAFVGSWFYGAVDDESRAALYASWGLLEDAPAYTPPSTEGRGQFNFGFILNTES